MMFFFFPTKKRTRGLYCWLIPLNLVIEQMTGFCTKPHYTRPKILYITFHRKCHYVQGIVNLGNLYFKRICEKPLLNKIKIHL